MITLPSLGGSHPAPAGRRAFRVIHVCNRRGVRRNASGIATTWLIPAGPTSGQAYNSLETGPRRWCHRRVSHLTVDARDHLDVGATLGQERRRLESTLAGADDEHGRAGEDAQVVMLGAVAHEFAWKTAEDIGTPLEPRDARGDHDPMSVHPLAALECQLKSAFVLAISATRSARSSGSAFL